MYLDSKRVYPTIGITEQQRILKNITVGRYQLIIRKDNYLEEKLSITINSGQNPMGFICDLGLF